jgi:hypothetical protein
MINNRSIVCAHVLVDFAWQTIGEQSQYNESVNRFNGLSMADDELVAGSTEATNRKLLLAEEWQGYRKSWRFFLLFINKRWLTLAKQHLFVFAPKCIRPAAYFTIGMLIVLSSTVLSYQQLKSDHLDLSKLLMSAGYLLFSMFFGVPLMFIGIAKWLLTITAFCRFWMLNDLCTIDKDVLKQRCDQDFNDVSKRKMYLAKFGLTSALLSAMPVLICFLFFVLKLATMSAVMSLKAIALPPGMSTALDVMIAVMFIGVLAFSLVAIPVAAVSELPPQRAAIWAALVAMRCFPQCALITIVVCFASVVISTPQALFELGSANMLMPPDNLGSVLLSQLWEGITSVVLVPASMVPFCELLRGPMYESNKTV